VSARPRGYWAVIHSETHVERYSVAHLQIEEALLSFSILTNASAIDRGVVALNRVLLSVPFERVASHPGPIPHIVRVLRSLLCHGGRVSLDSLIREQCLAVAVVIDSAHVDRGAHLVRGGAGPRFKLVFFRRILYLHVHHDHVAFIQ